MGETWGAPPVLDIGEEASLHRALIALAVKGLLRSTNDLSDGGCVTALVRASLANNLGVRIEMNVGGDPSMIVERLFSEIGSSVIASIAPEKLDDVQAALKQFPGVFLAPLGQVIANSVEIALDGTMVIGASTSEFGASWLNALEEELADQVVLA